MGVSTSADCYEPRPSGPLPRLPDAQRLSEVVSKIEAAEPLTALEARIIAGGGSPLGGAKPKALIDIGGESWVIKFFNNEPVDTPLVEHATMTLAARAGIAVATTQLVPLVGFNAVAIRRFDRLPGGQRIHSISAGTAIRATTPAGMEPPLGYPALARILRRVGVAQEGQNQRDAQELFRRMVFNILIDNTDDHEKNHALLAINPHGHGRYRLAPAYDVLPSNVGQGYQEFICGTLGQESTLNNAMSECDAFGLTPAEAAQEVARVVAVVNNWQAHFREMGVAPADIAHLASFIDGPELLNQRLTFDPSLHTAGSPPRSRPATAGRAARKSPFAPD